LPTFRKFLIDETLELSSLFLVFLLIFSKEFIPFLLSFSALGCGLVIKIIDFIRNNKGALRIETTDLSIEVTRAYNICLMCLASSALRAFPWTLPVPASLLPKPMVVVNLMTDGLSLTDLATSIAFSMASTS
jgi:hypothetical protein